MESSAQFIRLLRAATRNCSPDMHEPDCVGAVVLGNHLDNAMDASPARNCGEFIIGLQTPEGKREWFNLATMIAILRNQQWSFSFPVYSIY